MISDRCPVCPDCLSCPVCNVGVLWPNGWMDRGETRHAGRPRPWPHSVRWGLSSPPLKGESRPQFSAYICCGKMAEWIKMPLGVEVGLGPGDFVLDGDPALSSLKRRWSRHFWLMSIMAKQLDGSRWHLARRWASVQATLC